MLSAVLNGIQILNKIIDAALPPTNATTYCSKSTTDAILTFRFPVPTTSPFVALSIPEIFAMIIAYLDRPCDKVKVALLNKKFNRDMTPLLYKRLKFGSTRDEIALELIQRAIAPTLYPKSYWGVSKTRIARYLRMVLKYGFSRTFDVALEDLAADLRRWTARKLLVFKKRQPQSTPTFGGGLHCQLWNWSEHFTFLYADLITCLSLTNLNVSDTIVSAIVSRTRNLTQFKVSNCSDVSDKSIQSLVMAARHLKRLDLSNQRNVSNTCMYRIADYCQHLEYLEVSECEHITDVGTTHVLSRLSQLQVLKCARLYFGTGFTITQQTLESCAMHPNLVQLNVAGCWLEMRHLKTLLSKKRLDLLEVGFMQTESRLLETILGHVKELTQSEIKADALMIGIQDTELQHAFDPDRPDACSYQGWRPRESIAHVSTRNKPYLLNHFFTFGSLVPVATVRLLTYSTSVSLSFFCAR
ncbi:hypothetical protein EDD86DRAFT_83883 [Gorgonomyces haynaldii]|nr:hypothetical protein EDD86DRAFT_83883 [Gorgonomyces haynaldii]